MSLCYCQTSDVILGDLQNKKTSFSSFFSFQIPWRENRCHPKFPTKIIQNLIDGGCRTHPTPWTAGLRCPLLRHFCYCRSWRLFLVVVLGSFDISPWAKTTPEPEQPPTDQREPPYPSQSPYLWLLLLLLWLFLVLSCILLLQYWFLLFFAKCFLLLLLNGFFCYVLFWFVVWFLLLLWFFCCFCFGFYCCFRFFVVAVGVFVVVLVSFVLALVFPPLFHKLLFFYYGFL